MSGQREVWSGIFWDDEAEDIFGRLVFEWTERFPAVAAEPRARARAEQSARWYVELFLLRRTINEQAEKALSLCNSVEKHRIHTEWLRIYGARLTDAIVRAVKDPALRSPDLGRRL